MILVGVIFIFNVLLVFPYIHFIKWLLKNGYKKTAIIAGLSIPILLLFGIEIISAVTIFIGIPVALIWGFRYLMKKLRKKGFPKMATIISIVVPAFIFYIIYTAFYPTDDFYEEEFKSGLKISISQSAKIIDKNASFPDFHGDYSACFVMKIKENEFQELAQKFPANYPTDKIPREIPANNILDGIDESKVLFIHEKHIASDNVIYLIFFNDNKRVIFYHSVT